MGLDGGWKHNCARNTIPEKRDLCMCDANYSMKLGEVWSDAAFDYTIWMNRKNSLANFDYSAFISIVHPKAKSVLIISTEVFRFFLQNIVFKFFKLMSLHIGMKNANNHQENCKKNCFGQKKRCFLRFLDINFFLAI